MSRDGATTMSLTPDAIAAALAGANSTQIAALVAALQPVLDAVPPPDVFGTSVDLLGYTLTGWEFFVALYLCAIPVQFGVFISLGAFTGFDIETLAEKPSVREAVGTFFVVVVPLLVTLLLVAFFATQNVWVIVMMTVSTALAANVLHVHLAGKKRRAGEKERNILVWVCTALGPLMSAVIFVAEITDLVVYACWEPVCMLLKVPPVLDKNAIGIADRDEGEVRDRARLLDSHDNL